MKIEFKHGIGERIETPQGPGEIIMLAVDKDGPKYLVQFTPAGKAWVPEEKTPKAPEREGDVKSAAAKVASLILVCVLWFALAGPAHAQHYNPTDGYVTAVAATNGTTPEVVFAGSPTKTIRLLSVLAESTTNAAHLYLFSGTTPYTVTGVINGTNLTVTSNAGVQTNRLAILQYGGTNWTFTVLSTNNLTNIFLAGGSGLGFTPLTNSVFWNCGRLYLDQIGIAKRQMAGDALFAGVVRGPLAVRLEPPAVASASNRLAATVRYDLN